MTNVFDLDHDLDVWIFKVKYGLDLWPHTWPCPWIFMAKFWNSCFSEWEGPLTLYKVGGCRSFMTMTVTIWWPRSGVRIYQIATGVTSVVGMPSTHLVYTNIFYQQSWVGCKSLSLSFDNSKIFFYVVLNHFLCLCLHCLQTVYIQLCFTFKTESITNHIYRKKLI